MLRKLPAIKPKLKSGQETLKLADKDLPFTVLDFWRWAFSDLLSNATRGKLAEFIVASALDVDLQEASNEWGAYDLSTQDGLKIEVKTSAYVQAWSQKDYSKPVFSIAKAKYWDPDTGMSDEAAKRHADIYVFCLLKEKDQSKINPLQLEQWDFFVVPRRVLDKYKRNQRSITLASLLKLTKAVGYNELKQAVSQVDL